MQRLIVSLEAKTVAFEKAMNKALGVANTRATAIERRFQKMNSNITSTFSSSLRNSVSGLVAALGVRELVNYADAWTQAGNKIRAAGTIAGVQTRSLNDLKDGANEARAEFEIYVDLYAKLIRSSSGVAKSELEIATATDIVTKSFKAGGAATQEQIAGILQLSQALGSGVLQGDELRSIRENAPLLAKAIADEFGVTIAGLKKLGAEGKITSDRVFKAILAAQRPIEAAFASTNATIKDSITRINNEFTAYIGNADSSAGASRKLVEALTYLADNFSTVADAALSFATVLGGAFAGKAIGSTVAGLARAILALGAFLTALRTGTVVAAGFSAALGPIGILAGAAAAAVYLLYDANSDAEKAAEAHQKMLGELKFQIENVDYANSLAVASTRSKISSDIAAAEVALTRAKAERELAAAISASMVRPEMQGLLPAPDISASDLADVVSGDPVVKDRQAVIDQTLKQIEDLKAAQSTFEDYASGKKKPERDNTGFGAGVKSGGDGSGKKKKNNEFQREIEQIKERTEALKAETEAMAGINPLIDDYGYAVEYASAKQELLNAAKQAGLEITPALAANIDTLASAYAKASAESEKLAEEQDKLRDMAEEFNGFAKDILGGFIQDLKDGKSATEALENALAKVADKLLDIALSSIFGGSGGIGGFLAGLFGGFAEGGYTGNGAKNQPAGTVHKGEYVFSKKATQKIGVANLEAMHRGAKGYASGVFVGPAAPRFAGPPAAPTASYVSVSISAPINAPGADPAQLARVERSVQELGRNVPKIVVKTMRDKEVRKGRV